jgi:lipid-binding SYLF domain-containing protein
MKESEMKRRELLIVFSLVFACSITAAAKSKEEKKAELRKKAQATLARLYKARPSAQAAVKKAAGYAVFNSSGVKILVAGGGKGQGLAVDNATQKVTYMKMREIQAGLGMGVKKFSTIFVFETKAALEKFINSGGNLVDKRRQQPKQVMAVARIREQRPYRKVYGCIS